MKPVPLTIEVPLPCSETWDEMQSSDSGKYCQSCAKQVTDFAGFTDQELVHYFKNRNGDTCGRFRLDQLDRELYSSVIQKGSRSPRNYWLAGVLGLTGLTLYGQSFPSKVQHESCQQIKPVIVLEGTAAYSFVGSHFHGQVVGNKNQPLPQAIITFVQGRIAKGVIADNFGRFTIQRETFIDTLITLTISANADDNQHISMIQEMETVEIQIDKNGWGNQDYLVGRYPYSRDVQYITSFTQKGFRAFLYKLFHLRKWRKYKRALKGTL